MCLATNIARRNGSAVYYARLAVPKELQAIFGAKERWESLRTKDAREAKVRVLEVLQRWSDEFATLRRKLASTEPAADEIEAVTWGHYQGELEHHQIERRVRPTSRETDLLTEPVALRRDVSAFQKRSRAVRKKTLEDHLGQGETALVHHAARSLITRENWAIGDDTPEFRDLCERLQRAKLEALRRAEEQDQGDFTGRPADPAVKAPKKAATAIAAPGEGVLELFDAFARENPKGVKPDTLRMNREIVTWFAQHVGPTFPASAIDNKAVREWKQALAKFPIKAAEVREFRGLSFTKIIVANDRLRRSTLSDRTVNKYLSALGAYCQWLMRNGHIDSNPVDGMHLGNDKGDNKVRPYTSEQLQKVFASPLFTGTQSEKQVHKPGNFKIRDHRYWLPLLSLFTGARMGELAQLLVADVRQDRGRWIIHITSEGDTSKVVKTKGSMRVLPIHPELERLGFLRFHAKCAGSRLFPEIKPDARETLTGHYLRFWARYLQKIGVKTDASVNFHSFRHGMADALRRAGYRDEEFGFLLGHTQATTTGRYGILAEGDLMQRCKMIEAVNFPGLDLNHLLENL
ncbi:tyrosine-type recombinase/integrase [Methylobacterium sp. BTF04]|uniref:site-specific integrase n=1 Tax=Methylobacterium sp. BTF04 TaxID=2708300 RepID=UPI0013D09039|nr:site-specific integrase [Methylobacterium sp. BTF04]NEU14587.1 tyrosine-type recombinase/integrase [Methylobacterium sp. BTF04]